jgi:hypothetical protein
MNKVRPDNYPMVQLLARRTQEYRLLFEKDRQSSTSRHSKLEAAVAVALCSEPLATL